MPVPLLTYNHTRLPAADDQAHVNRATFPVLIGAEVEPFRNGYANRYVNTRLFRAGKRVGTINGEGWRKRRGNGVRRQ